MALNRVLYEEFGIPFEISDNIWNICIIEKIHRIAAFKQNLNKQILEITKSIYYGIEIGYNSIKSQHKNTCDHVHWYMGIVDNDNVEIELPVTNAAANLIMMDISVYAKCEDHNMRKCNMEISDSQNLSQHISSIYCMTKWIISNDNKFGKNYIPEIIENHLNNNNIWLEIF